jgi:hypothetical protein
LSGRISDSGFRFQEGEPTSSHKEPPDKPYKRAVVDIQKKLEVYQEIKKFNNPEAVEPQNLLKTEDCDIIQGVETGNNSEKEVYLNHEQISPNLENQVHTQQ